MHARQSGLRARRRRPGLGRDEQATTAQERGGRRTRASRGSLRLAGPAGMSTRRSAWARAHARRRLGGSCARRAVPPHAATIGVSAGACGVHALTAGAARRGWRRGGRAALHHGRTAHEVVDPLAVVVARSSSSAPPSAISSASSHLQVAGEAEDHLGEARAAQHARGALRRAAVASGGHSSARAAAMPKSQVASRARRDNAKGGWGGRSW